MNYQQALAMQYRIFKGDDFMSDIDDIIIEIEQEQDKQRLNEMTKHDRKSFDQYAK